MAKNKKAKKAHKKKRGNSVAGVDEHVLDRLYLVIDSRKGADPDTSYTARLFSRGRQQIAKKLGEEAVEAVWFVVGRRNTLSVDDSSLAP